MKLRVARYLSADQRNVTKFYMEKSLREEMSKKTGCVSGDKMILILTLTVVNCRELELNGHIYDAFDYASGFLKLHYLKELKLLRKILHSAFLPISFSFGALNPHVCVHLSLTPDMLHLPYIHTYIN
jgi:hypothetical protein